MCDLAACAGVRHCPNKHNHVTTHLKQVGLAVVGDAELFARLLYDGRDLAVVALRNAGEQMVRGLVVERPCLACMSCNFIHSAHHCCTYQS